MPGANYKIRKTIRQYALLNTQTEISTVTLFTQFLFVSWILFVRRVAGGTNIHPLI